MTRLVQGFQRTQSPQMLTPNSQCPCGSGLRAARCCHIAEADLPPPHATRHLVPLVERAIQAHRTGAIETAERLCLDVLELAPDRPGALSVLYDIRKAQGVHTAAEALLRRIVILDPNNFAATNELTLLLLGNGALGEAEMHARNCVRIEPQNPQSHNLMGMVCTEMQRPVVGEYHYRRALELTGERDAILLANLAWNLKAQGRVAEARALYEESVVTNPHIPQTLLGWARLEEADRQFDVAATLLDRLEAKIPGAPAAKLARATLLGRTRQPDAALALLDELAQTQDGLAANELLEKGRLLDQLGRYDDAFAVFTQAKEQARTRGRNEYLGAHAQDHIRRIKTFISAERMKLMPRASIRTDIAQPIFILGFPRSGTTLMEQSLSAHSRITAGDELPFVHEIAAIMPRLLNSPLTYPEALAELWMGDQREGLDMLRDHYLQKVRQLGILTQGAAWFTDKMPLNETHMALIALMFPQAPMIHVIRHPLDVMVSAISNMFTHGFNCAFALESAARHYVLVADLVQHCRAEMTMRYLPVRYEDVVARQEATLRDVLGFLGEEFEPACLHFEQNRRYARTASYAQVTEKLYDRSVCRYRNYLRHLEPVIPILTPVIERLGYTI